MYTWQSGNSSRISIAIFDDTVQQIFEHHSRPIWRSREPTQRSIATRFGLRPSDGQRTPSPDEIICSTCVVVTTSACVPKPHSGLLTESKCVKPLQSITASASTESPLDSLAVKSPGVPSKSVTVAPVTTETPASSSTRLTMPPIASFAHSPVGTSLAYPDKIGAPPSLSSFSTMTHSLPTEARL